MTTLPPTLYQTATAFASASLSVIPVDPSSKRPTLESWAPYQTTRATPTELLGWFTPNGHLPAQALAIICGVVSEGITVIDFDTMANGSTLYDEWASLVEEAMPGLLARLVVVATPSGGRHVYMRCSVCDGNTKLAESPKRQTWIETRGEGGYVLAPMSPGYKTIQGSLTKIPTLDPSERSLLLTAARTLTKFVQNHGKHLDTDSLPGAAFNAKISLDEMERWLKDAGWTYLKTRADGTRVLCRPGKSGEVSATLGQGGMRSLYVFSSNAAPFEQNTGYAAFAIYAMFHHNGDYSAAARQLAADGIGGTRQSRQHGREETLDETLDAELSPSDDAWFVSFDKEVLAVFEPSMLLAPSLVNFVADARDASGFPVEFIAAPVLASASACIGATAKIRIAGTWLDSASLWIGLVGRPGTGKSPSLNLGLDAVRKLQADWYKVWKKAVAQYGEELADWEAADRKYRGQKPAPPQARRLLTNDTTIEALIPLLDHNPRGLLLDRDELAGWIKGFNQYKQGGGSDREYWLSIWSSTPIMVDRKAELSFTYLQDPFVSVIGGIQPSKLKGLLGGEEDGFSDRFLLFYPEAAPHGLTDVVLDRSIRDRLGNLLSVLTEVAFEEDEEGANTPRIFELDPQARALFSQRLDAAVALGFEPNVTDALSNAYSKAGSHAARIALVLHIAQCFDGVDMDQVRINSRTVRAAWAIVDVALSHLRRVHAEYAVAPQDALVQKAVKWIERNGRIVTVRQMMQGKCPGATSASSAKALLYQLDDRRLGRISIEKQKRGSDRVTFALAWESRA